MLPEGSVGPTVITLPVEDEPMDELPLPVVVVEEDDPSDDEVGVVDDDPPVSVVTEPSDVAALLSLPVEVVPDPPDDDVAVPFDELPGSVVTEESGAEEPPLAPVEEDPDDPPMTVIEEEEFDWPRAPGPQRRISPRASGTAIPRRKHPRCVRAIDPALMMASPFDCVPRRYAIRIPLILPISNIQLSAFERINGKFTPICPFTVIQNIARSNQK
jgi:hypothetical protein